MRGRGEESEKGGGGYAQAKMTQESHAHMKTVRKINTAKPKGGHAL